MRTFVAPNKCHVFNNTHRKPVGLNHLFSFKSINFQAYENLWDNYLVNLFNKINSKTINTDSIISKRTNTNNLIANNGRFTNIKTTHILGDAATFNESKINNLIGTNGTLENIKTNKLNSEYINSKNIKTDDINTINIDSKNINSEKGLFESLEVSDIDVILMNANKLFSNEFESKMATIDKLKGTNFNSINATIDNISCKQIESNEFVTLSDINQKKNIIYNKLNYNLLDLLNIIQFNYKNEEDTEQPHFGFIAQEIEANYPNLVVRDSENNLRVKYIELIPLLLMYNKALKNDINRIYEIIGKK